MLYALHEACLTVLGVRAFLYQDPKENYPFQSLSGDSCINRESAVAIASGCSDGKEHVKVQECLR